MKRTSLWDIRERVPMVLSIMKAREKRALAMRVSVVRLGDVLL